MNGFIAGTVFIWPAGGHGGIQPPAVWVCASYPGKLYSSVEGANFLQGRGAGGCGGLRLGVGKALFLR